MNEKKCTKKIAVKMAMMGMIRGVVSCPVCEFGHSPYDVVKQPEKYKDIIEEIKREHNQNNEDI